MRVEFSSNIIIRYLCIRTELYYMLGSKANGGQWSMSCSLVLQGRIVVITGNFGLLGWCFLHVKFLMRQGAASAIVTRVMFCNSSGNGMNQTLRKHHFSRSLGLWFQIGWKSAILGTLFNRKISMILPLVSCCSCVNNPSSS